MTKHGAHTSEHQLPPHYSSRLRNLWAAPPAAGGGGGLQWSAAAAAAGGCDSSGNLSSSSVASSRTYYQPATTSVYQDPLPLRGGDNYALPRDALLPAAPQAPVVFVRRPITPASGATSTDAGGGVNPCGGHCVQFENFCHYCLQVMNIAGILTGVVMVAAGFVLRNQRKGGNLEVLIYIGCLTALVCGLLLSVQCCVRRNLQQRRQRIRARGPGPAGGETIQLQMLGPPPPPPPPPLLRPLMPPHQLIRPTRDQSGLPWWRREEIP
ncbi:uncharacterized protein LOC111051104 isoform X2 [Nilaparvata lugens]|uniref:uncharacterized protein LOC111051104 isoform X2 n=1 Tax=Nilaparvata lugens TaxID=108931 RepID=UPI000B994AC7|nr:uncharacterized protein LOC111051104 isoform X2 [Nilaparvata lugens]